ncbi:STAS/SEC14 domain-containing protein [Sorangium sp. So ce1151]|uniref:STAS/SEC14 domain-containing protein n=1 Tax=Sorangium sp. So ce1151 TaxID=3133332 RepID=UPI003F61E63F
MSDVGLENAYPEVREEPDGILRVEVHGDLTDDRARAVVGALRRVAESGREVLALADMRHTGAIPASARKVMAEELRTARPDAVAIIGAGFSLRVVVALLAKGVHMLTGQPYPQQFFGTEGEARAWLLAQRDALRARRRPVP